MQRQLSRQGYGDGTGVICRINEGTPDTTLEVDTPMVGKNPTDYFSIGNGIMAASDTSGTSAAYTTITGITGNNSLGITAATGMVDNDYLFIAHNNGTTSPTVSNINAEIMGLKGLIDDATNVATFEGLARGTYIWWKSYVNSNTTQRSLTDALMHTTYLEAKKKGDPKYALTHFDVFSAYGQLLTPDRRYSDTMTLKGGFTGVNFNGIPVVADYDCPYDEMYFIDPSTLSVEDLAPMSFMDDDGSILDRSSTQPIWMATLRYYANLANSACNKSSALRDVIK